MPTPPVPPLLPPDHPDRQALAAEVHARPPEPLTAPCRASYVAVRIEPEARDAERAHIATLCAAFGVPPPGAASIQWVGTLGTLRFKWERHGEFSSYTVFAPGTGPTPFADPVAAQLPGGWLAGVPGQTVCAVHAELADAHALPDTIAQPTPGQLAAYFSGNVVVGAHIGDGAAVAYTDFVVHGDGFGRILLVDRELTERQAGRMLQRLFEIEAYRMMAMLALPAARALGPELVAIERTLATLTDRMAGIAASTAGAAKAGGAGRAVGWGPPDRSSEDEPLLQELTALAAQVERAIGASQTRFSASRAYHALVLTRIGELREQRIRGLQTIDEFMTRRMSPAMATCANAAQRLADLSERVAQASSLLSTRVDIVRERQNQLLLQATARRAKLQLRLQQTVEGLSLAAIVYYMAGLVGYLAKAGKAAGLPLSPDLVTGLAVPVLAGVAMWVLRRAHHKLADAGSGG